MRFFSKLFESDTEPDAERRGQARSGTSQNALADEKPSQGAETTRQPALWAPAEDEESESPIPLVRSGAGRTSATRVLPPEVLAVRARQTELSGAQGADGAFNRGATPPQSTALASPAPSCPKSNNPWSEPLSVPTAVVGSSTAANAVPPTNGAAAVLNNGRIRSRGATAKQGTVPSGSTDDQAWALLRPPASLSRSLRKSTARAGSVPSVPARSTGNRSSAPSNPRHPSHAADAAGAVPAAPVEGAAPQSLRPIPTVMVRVTTQSKDSTELFKVREEDEEPTNPGVGLLGTAPGIEIPSSGETQVPLEEPPTGGRLQQVPRTGPTPTAEQLAERLVLKVLLGTVAELSPEQRRRVVEAGTSLADIGGEEPTALSALNGPPELLEVVRQTCQQYAAMRAERRAQALSRSALHKALADMARRVAAFRQCDEDDRSQRRALRRQLQQAATDLNLLVAERGDKDLLHQLERSAVADRLVLLRDRLLADVQGEETGRRESPAGSSPGVRPTAADHPLGDPSLSGSTLADHSPNTSTSST